MGPLVREEKLLEKEKGKYPIKKLRESVYVYDNVTFSSFNLFSNKIRAIDVCPRKERDIYTKREYSCYLEKP